MKKSRAQRNRELKEDAQYLSGLPGGERERRKFRSLNANKGRTRQKGSSALSWSHKGGASYDLREPRERNLIVYRIGEQPP